MRDKGLVGSCFIKLFGSLGSISACPCIFSCEDYFNNLSESGSFKVGRSLVPLSVVQLTSAYFDEQDFSALKKSTALCWF